MKRYRRYKYNKNSYSSCRTIAALFREGFREVRAINNVRRGEREFVLFWPFDSYFKGPLKAKNHHVLTSKIGRIYATGFNGVMFGPNAARDYLRVCLLFRR